jgi:5'-methylthioadenosine phosphorylase
MLTMKLAILTGSGTYSLPALKEARVREVATRFGRVTLSEGAMANVEVVHLARHGEGHARLSSQVNHRAHVLALREVGVQAVIAVTVCGAVDPAVALGSTIVFDDLHFLANRLPDGSICSLYDEPGMPGRGHWVFEQPFSEPLRRALLDGARAAGLQPRDGGCYGHVDGPRFNTRTEIAMLAGCGVCAVSQTAGPETVLCGEAELPYALLGYATDYANGVSREPTPVTELTRLIGESTATFSEIIEQALPCLPAAPIAATGTHIRWA